MVEDASKNTGPAKLGEIGHELSEFSVRKSPRKQQGLRSAQVLKREIVNVPDSIVCTGNRSGIIPGGRCSRLRMLAIDPWHLRVFSAEKRTVNGSGSSVSPSPYGIIATVRNSIVQNHVARLSVEEGYSSCESCGEKSQWHLLSLSDGGSLFCAFN